MKIVRPVLIGWRCDGGHTHDIGQDCPNDYVPHEERAWVFGQKEVDPADTA